MALTDTARLATVLTLKDGLTPGMGKPIKAVGKFDDGVSRAGKKVSAFGGKLKTAGAIAGGALAGGLLVAVKDGLQNLGELESATTSVDAALRQTGKSGKVTAGQIADWANEIEAATDAAFDDKAITAATTTLIRYGKVTTANIKPAMEVMTDLAAKTGSVESASELLGKALADPEKAAGRLTRAGIKLTDAQQEQIKKFIKAGDLGKAQAVVLDAIAKSTKGAAKAMNGPYVDAQRKLSDAVEEGTKALAIGFLPIITRVSDKLQKALADPKVIDNIKKFGQGLADGFDKALDFAEKIPWEAIGNGVKTAAQWSAKLFDAFRTLPPEMQATIVALAGLNKLSGGAITGIVSELGKGLIKGVLGMTAGVVNLKAGVVNGGGAGPGGGGGGGAGSVLGFLGTAGFFGAIAAAVGEGMRQVNASVFANLFPPDVARTLERIANNSNPLSQIAGTLHDLASLPDKIGSLPAEIGRIVNFVTGGANPGDGVKTNFAGGRGGPPVTPAVIKEGTKPTKDAVVQSQGVLDRNLQATRSALHNKLEGVRAAEAASAATFREGERASRAATTAKLSRVSADVRHSGDTAKNATNSLKGAVTGKLNTANSRLAQIRAKRMSFQTNVQVGVRTNVSVRNVNDSNTTSNNYGSKTTNKVL